MKKAKNTIKFRLNITALSVVLILFILGAITYYYLHVIFSYNKLLTCVNHISILQLQVRKAEKDFIFRESINPEFYNSNQSVFIDDFNQSYLKINKSINFLQHSSTIKKLRLNDNLEKLDTLFIEYHRTFNELIKLIKNKGFENYGDIGKMRDQIHLVEDIINNNMLAPEFQVHMLMLRRHEKDYLLRKNIKYKTKFNERINLFISELKDTKKSKLTTTQANKIINILNRYKYYFNEIISLDVKIGLTEKEGIMYELLEKVKEVEINLDEIVLFINKGADEKITEALYTLILVGLLLAFGIILLLVKLRNYITKSIRHLHKYVTRLGKGELPQKIKSKFDDEIADMINSINILTENLANTKKFAIEVGKGNLNTDINVFDNKGDLGGSLIEMRNRLYQLSLERKQNELDTAQRNWVNEGTAKFGNVLRKNNTNMELFALDVIDNLMQYVNAVQGGIFIINDEDKNNIHFELKAAIAFGKSKLKQKRVQPGEDMIGLCILDKKMIHLKEVPDNYIYLDTGLARMKPHELIIAPLILNNNVMGVVELATLYNFEKHHVDFIERLGRAIAATISIVKSNIQTHFLLKQSQEQAIKLKERQNQIEEQKEELIKQAQTLKDTNQALEFHQKRIESSINYAKTIQNAILPSSEKLAMEFSNYFILYRPKDVVSGDFYWFSKIEDNENKIIFIAAVDCTGHGVPGAFMSMIGSSLLNSIVNEKRTKKPAEILELLNQKIIKSLGQDENTTDDIKRRNSDGMDICLCKIEKTKKQKTTVTFCGAKRPLYYSKGGKIVSIKGSRKSIGGVNKRKKGDVNFVDNEINVAAGEMIYLTTDGLVDQNNKTRTKFGTIKLLELLNEINTKPVTEQNKILQTELDAHQLNEEQRDDITIIGIRL